LRVIKVKRDSIFYQIFKRFPTLLFEIIDKHPEGEANYRFESVEVKETAFRFDGIFLPPEDAETKVVFFVEVQFQKDEFIYYRFFTELMMYLNRNRGQFDDWYGVVIFPSRSLEPSDTTIHRLFLNSDQIQRIYLDELGASNAGDEQLLGISLVQLTIASDEAMAQQAKELIERVKLEEGNRERRDNIVDIITTIAVYKLSSLSREEVEAMLGVSLEETKVYQDAKAEGVQEGQQLGQQLGREEILRLTVPLLLKSGMTVEQIAQQLNVTIESVQLAVGQNT
jgi:predicted transposase/invertase (TIGR01784 family)